MLPVAILMGGFGTRLRPLTYSTPKALLPIHGEPFVAHQLRLLRNRGIERVVLCVGYLGEQIRDFVKDGQTFGLAADYSWDGEMPLGTGGAIRKALPKLGEAFFVIYGDSYLTCNYNGVEDAFLGSKKQGLMTVFRNEGQGDTSNIEICNGKILAYNKQRPTPAMHYIDYGLGALRSCIFQSFPGSTYDLADIYQYLLQNNELESFEVKERFYEAGSFEGIRSLSELLNKTAISSR